MVVGIPVRQPVTVGFVGVFFLGMVSLLTAVTGWTLSLVNCSLRIISCIAVSGALWSSGAPAQSTNDFVLLYAGNAKARPSWSPEELAHYVSCDGRAQKKRSFFRGFVVLETRSETGHSFVHGSRTRPGGPPASQEEWRALLDGWFAKDGVLWNLSRALVRVSKSETAQIWLGLPEPLSGAIFEFGQGHGHGRALKSASDKLSAVEWFVKRAITNWKREKFRNLLLMGFYWQDESLKFAEELITDVSLVVKSQGTVEGMLQPLKLLWIPFWKSPKKDDWRVLGFDVAVIQPNYFVKDRVDASRVAEATEYALKFGMGLELEIDHRISNSQEHVDRAVEYLRVLEAEKSRQVSLVGLYQGNAALLNANLLPNDFSRGYLTRLCDFVADRRM